MHFIVEVIVLVQTYLSPGQECLRSVVQQAIRNSRDNGGDKELISPLKVLHTAVRMILHRKLFTQLNIIPFYL